MDTNKVPKSSSHYYCNNCDYTTSRKSQYERHLLTGKHIRIHTNTEKGSKKFQIYICENCGREYKFHSGLWKHKKTCYHLEQSNTELSSTTQNNSNYQTNQDDTDNKDLLILELLKQNSEFQKLMAKETSELRNIITEQSQKMMEMAGNMGNNNNNTINSNNKFNLNVFLNEKCKNAMTLTDFVKSINLTVEDFIETGERGFIDGISNIIVERINNMELHDRPLHCTDLKRETVYIKDAEKWEKDEDKNKLRKAVKWVANKNERMRPIWYEQAPGVDVMGTENYEKFFKYSESSLGGCGKEETKLFEDKVMKNVLKEVTIDKERALNN